MFISDEKLIHVLSNELFDWLVTLKNNHNIEHLDSITLIHVDKLIKQTMDRLKEGEESCQEKLLF